MGAMNRGLRSQETVNLRNQSNRQSTIANRQWPLLLLCLLAASACIQQPAESPTPTSSSSDAEKQIDEIWERYLSAVGGREAIERSNSFHGKGTFTTSLSNLRGSYEVWGKDPDKSLSIMTFSPSVVIRKGFDGTTRWLQTPLGTFVDESPDVMAEVERDAEIYRTGKISSLYDKMLLLPNARLHGHEVYVVEGKPAQGPSDKLYFDVKDGLLLRWDMVRRNPKRGNVFVKIHLDNYTQVDDIKVPFKVRFAFESFSLTLIMDELKNNVAIDDRFFKQPNS